MLNIIIIIVAVCIVIWLVQTLWDLIQGLWDRFKIVIIIVAAVGLGPIILSAFSQLLFVIAALLIWLYIKRRKYRLQLSQLERRGIEPFSAQANWDKVAGSVGSGRIELSATAGCGYVISTVFYKSVIEVIGRTCSLTRDAFGEYCVQSAEEFQMIYVDPLLDFLQTKNLLFPLYISSGEIRYLSKPFVSDCENLFMIEGAATKNEFAQICGKADVTRELHKDSDALAAFILDRMLSDRKIKEIELSGCESGDRLYVAKEQIPNSKMTHREISLDE